MARVGEPGGELVGNGEAHLLLRFTGSGVEGLEIGHEEPA
jgi:hypothetical protein